MWHNLFGVLIILVSGCGVIINCVAFVLLSRKRRQKSAFHNLLKILAAYDLLVVLCSALSYGLPNVWQIYNEQVN